MTELLKARIVQPNPERSIDGMAQVALSPMQDFATRSTLGPYNGELRAPDVRTFLSDPSNVIVVACGRNEEKRGNLGPSLTYHAAATSDGNGGVGNVLFVDANSADKSLALAQSMEQQGVEATSRRETLSKGIVDIAEFARLLGLSEDSLQRSLNEGPSSPLSPGDVAFRKGMDVFAARMLQLKARIQGRLSRWSLYADTDILSTANGPKAQVIVDELGESALYFPLELAARATIDAQHDPKRSNRPWAVFTGSGNRNNEPVFSAINTFHARATDDDLTEQQRAIADAFVRFSGTIVHPLTGELIIDSEVELAAMGATGQCVEAARILSLTAAQLRALNTVDPDELPLHDPQILNVRRGTQMRIDEPQDLSKEWSMIVNTIPVFVATVGNYAINKGKNPVDFDLEDFARINQRLARPTHLPRLDADTQTRVFDHIQMDRLIPPVDLLQSAGIIDVTRL